MARTSKRYVEVKEEQKERSIYKAAIYTRLSNDRTEEWRAKSSSIETQSRAKDLEEQVFAAIKEKYGNETQKTIEKRDSSKELERKVESLENKKMKSFDKYKLGNISRAKFIDMKAKLDEEIESLKAQIRRIKEEEANHKEIREDGLTREMMQKYIQSVICGHNEVLEIQWK